MSWYLQTPDSSSPKLLKNIVEECEAATKGAGSFAFASAMGVKLLAAEVAFQKLLVSFEFFVVVGLDAITDTKALVEIRNVHSKYPFFMFKLFLHGITGSCFHPKTMWLRTAEGGVIITGSGNLTSGGLKANWEATAVEKLSVAEMDEAEAKWNSWITAHAAQLLDPDDPQVIEKAAANKIQRGKIKKVLKLPEAEENEAVEEAAEEVADDLALSSPILIVEVSKNRPGQVEVGIGAYQEFFGVTLGSPKQLRFHQRNTDGSLGEPEDHSAVAVVSDNYRVEVGVLRGTKYPENGHPIVIFEKITDSTFDYIALQPGEPAHTTIQKYLDDNYIRPATNRKLRIRITAADLQKIWPMAPLFL
jgi:HKD family nuclease